jgi:hypothetical protein
MILSILLLFVNGIGGAFAGEMVFKHSTVNRFPSQGHACADINGDGYPDIILAEGEFTTIFAWYEYPKWTRHDINTAVEKDLDYVPDCVTADIDGDGDIDIVVPNSRNYGSKVVYWFENPLKDTSADRGDPASRAFTRHIIWEQSANHIKDIAVTDMDNDTRPDIIVGHSSMVRIFYQNSGNSWKEVRTADVGGHEGMHVGDLDKDGFDDVVCRGLWLRNPGSRNGEWRKRTIADRGGTTRVWVADVNGDGRKDPIFSLSESRGNIAWYSADNPLTGPWTEHVVSPSQHQCHSLQSGDIDGDGTTDIMTAQVSGGVFIFRNLDGKGTQWKSKKIADESGYIAKLSDIGNDGDLDIVSSRTYRRGPTDLWINLLNPGVTLHNNRPYFPRVPEYRTAMIFSLHGRRYGPDSPALTAGHVSVICVHEDGTAGLRTFATKR